ncbi:helix-turn-helix domain-containing protein [Lacticaseibacillus songhuajiangensis]|uniref:helix-turn-helix domain-containing protein n=1 Tax=Lacticaseibacillus songhuajiangensis TaxID=1296539 RepID=UPI000F76EAFB|nr:helix-turn-helix domain-containing protein [Lacticaseibacillus songhuajiangensis]
MTLYDRLKETSKKRGISLQDVATRAGLGINSLYKWKSQAPTAPTIKAVADVLNVSVDYLLGNTDNPSPAPAADKIPAWATSADVAEWIDFIKEDQANNLNYKGIELTEEEKQQLIGAMSSVFWKHMKREKDRGGNA